MCGANDNTWFDRALVHDYSHIHSLWLRRPISGAFFIASTNARLPCKFTYPGIVDYIESYDRVVLTDEHMSTKGLIRADAFEDVSL